MNQNISSKDAAVSTDRKSSNDLNTISRSDTDLELVKRAQQGDAEAFAPYFMLTRRGCTPFACA